MSLKLKPFLTAALLVAAGVGPARASKRPPKGGWPLFPRASLIVLFMCQALCVSRANAELYVFIGDISGIPGQWEETLGGEWIFRPPITNYFVCACLGQEIHEHIMRRVAELPVRDDDPGFITLYGFPPCYLWVVDGNSKQVVAWHSINLKDFTTYECQTRVKVIFPDTTLCHEIGGEIIKYLQVPLTEDQIAHLPNCFQIPDDTWREGFVKNYRRFWAKMQSEAPRPVAWWGQEVRDLECGCDKK